MSTLFLVFAAVGGALLVLQLVLSAVGGDVGDIELGEGLQLLSVRSIIAAITFFGVGGLLGMALGLPSLLALGPALLFAAAAAAVDALLMRSLRRMESDGTVHVENAIGHSGTVYLRVPGERAGLGKVVLHLQGRSVEYQAVSASELPTGASVVVVDVVGPDTVEVAPPHYLGGTIDGV